MCRTSNAVDAGAADADTANADAAADLAPDDDGAVRPDADASMDARGDEADASALALLAPIRFHLRNDGSGDVYLGLRFIDRCAFDYTVTELEPNDGGADAGTPSVMIEQPMCPCHPSCTDCSTCALANCYELCDQDPPADRPRPGVRLDVGRPGVRLRPPVWRHSPMRGRIAGGARPLCPHGPPLRQRRPARERNRARAAGDPQFRLERRERRGHRYRRVDSTPVRMDR